MTHLLPFNPGYSTADPLKLQRASTSSYPFDGHESSAEILPPSEEERLEPLKEMIYKMAAMQPVEIDPAAIQKPPRRNVRISDDPQSAAARRRRERISERIRILRRLVPGGTKMDTASMLDEAVRYVKFLKRQVQELQSKGAPPALAAVHWPLSDVSLASGDQLPPTGRY